MSELSKNQLTQENTNSFPNNNTGYITPTILRTFNQNMIDSLVDEIQYNVDSASFNSRINVLDPSGSAAAILSLQVATASLNAYTASQNSFNSSATASIVALQNFSSSLDTTFATDTQLSASASTLQNNINTKLNTSSFNTYTASVSLGSYLLTSSFNTYTQSAASGVSASINAATQSLSASVAAINATQLSTSSFNTYTASASTNVSGAINTATQSLSSSVAAINASQLSTASFNVFTQSINTNISQINARVSSSATTGSNTFIGNQIISGNVNIAGNITADSASFLYLRTIYETASIIFSSGSNQLGDELIDVQTLSGSVKVQGTLTVNGVAVQTSSFDASGYLLTSSFNTYTQSAAANTTASINSATQSLSSSIATTTNGLSSSIGNLSSSIAVTTNNNTLLANQKLDSSSFNTYTQSNDIKVNALIAATGSYAISSSVAATFNAFSSSVSLTYATKTELSASASTLQNGINSKVENSTFNTYTQSQAAVNQGLTSAIATRLTTASFNTYTSSNDGKVNSLIAATGSYITSAQTSSMTVLSSSFAQTASFALNTQNIDTGSLVTTASFNAYTSSASTNVSASINSATQSLSSSIAVTTNNLDLEVNGKLDSSSFNTYTQSNDSKVNSLISATGSYITSAQTSSMRVLSSSFAVTASYAENVTPTDVSMFVSQSTFNAYTQSNNSVVNSLVSATSSYAISSSVAAIDASQDGRINSLTAQTSSYVTESETGSFATTGSNTFKASQIVSGNVDITGNITAVSASFIYINTIYETASVIYSSGSNQFGDELIDIQTLSGSVKVQGGLTVNGIGVILVGQTASYASASISSSYALSASFASNSSNTISSSFAQTASIANNVVVRATNDNASTLVRGTVVRITGANGDNPLFNSASWDNDSTSANALGILQSDVTSGTTGSIVVTGVVVGVNTDGMTAGNILYLSSSGQFTTVQPQAPLHIVTLGEVLRVQQNNGSIFVNISNGWELDELHNVAINGVADGDLLVYRSATSLWTNSSSAELGLVTTSSFNSYTSSNDGKVNSLISATSSYANSASVAAIDAAQLFTSSFNTYTSSQAAVNAGLTAAIAGKVSLNGGAINPQSITGSLIISGGVPTFPLVTLNNSSSNGLALSILSGSVEITSPQGTGYFYSNLPITSSNGRINGYLITKNLIVSGTGVGTPADTSGSVWVEGYVSASTLYAQNGIFGNLTGTASFATTASFALNVTSVDTGSFITTGSSAGTQAITGSLIISGATFNGKIEAPAIIISTVPTLDTLFESTASTTASRVISQIDFTRLGAGPTGDLVGTRLQTLSGSDTTGDTLLSRITTGVNRHTLTAMTGSSVNTILQSTWATGSMGVGRITYGSTITANAQSASATITLAAGNAASNYAGGTASFTAGRVNIGTTNATITSTGSFNHLGSLVTSAGITVNSGGITATAGTINGDLKVNGVLSITGSNPTILSGSLSGSLVSNLGSIYTASNAVKNIVNLGSASYASIVTPDANTLYVITGDEQYVLISQTGSFLNVSQTGSFATTGSNIFKGVQIISSSVRGEQYVGTVASSTASFDCTTGNFFTLVLGAGSNHISASNIRQGQTINVKVTTQSGNSVTCSTAIKQPSGSAYVPTNGAGTDILTFISYDTTLHMVAVKNFI